MLLRRSNTSGKRVLVTGAARGVGAETARILAERGARVALLDVDAERVAATAAALGPQAAAYGVDVRDGEQVRDAVQTAVDRLGGLDVTVANAGIIEIESLRDMTTEAFRRTMDVNLLGAAYTVRETLPAIVATGGYILVVSSFAAFLNLPYMAAYDASKAGVEAFANAIRAELQVERTDVDVGVAYFSMVETGLMRDAEHGLRRLAVHRISRNPMARRIPPERAARAVVRGIERRSRRLVVPWYYRPVRIAPNLAQGITDRYLRYSLRNVVRRAPNRDDG